MTGATPPAPLVGWPLLPVPDAEGCLRYPTLEDSVRDVIRVVLLTRPGEQLMRPEFGGGLERFLNEPNTVTTRRRIRDTITEALDRWEKRIAVDSVEVWEIPNEPSRTRVEIRYRLRRTGAAMQTGLSLQLEP